ncbi:hypothetical protein K474DRAFT_983486 [Panus rudis PR-1116 ss-1]|nr:hypothetical protein K474DRAFT_983486 [Panus rudis PR-1116 ss-1]
MQPELRQCSQSLLAWEENSTNSKNQAPRNTYSCSKLAQNLLKISQSSLEPVCHLSNNSCSGMHNTCSIDGRFRMFGRNHIMENSQMTAWAVEFSGVSDSKLLSHWLDIDKYSWNRMRTCPRLGDKYRPPCFPLYTQPQSTVRLTSPNMSLCKDCISGEYSTMHMV